MLNENNLKATDKIVAVERKSSMKKYPKSFSGLALSLSLAVTAHLFYPPLAQSEQKFNGREERSVAQMYDQDDLSACSLFAGNFINFGFWEEPISAGKVTVSQRIESEKNLYRIVIKNLGVDKEDRLLDVGCGLGTGTALAIEEFNPKEIHGIDFSQAQISRAQKTNIGIMQKYPGRIFFQQGAAENIPYAANSFEKICSVEAVQHFENADIFAKEANRVLTPGGKLAIVCFFGTSEKSSPFLSTMLQTVRDGIDKITPIYQFEETLKKNGLKNIKIESIGKNVWHGFDQWTAQGDLSDSWTRNWYKGYQKGLIDYYLITAEKPNQS